MHHLRRVFLGLLALIAVSGTLTSPVQAQKARKVPGNLQAAGSAHVAVLSIAPWEEYVAALQPIFPMDEARALKESLPDTRLAERQLADLISAGVKIALPSTARNATDEKSSTTTSSRTSEGETATATGTATTGAASSATTTKTAGDVSKVTIGSLPDAPAPLGPKESVLDGSIGRDPFLHYGAATALFQEVRVLQRYVRDALVAKGQEAYVVRLQVALMPAPRGVAMNAYTTLSILDGERSEAARIPTPSIQDELERIASPTTTKDTVRELQHTVADRLAPALGVSGSAKIRIVPLLVSDNLEGTRESSSSAELRQFAFGLLGMLSSVGISADARRGIETLEGFVGREMNSLLTVGQVSDNTIRVRFGAMNRGGSSVGLVPRNQTITLLVVKDREAPTREARDRRLRIVAKTDFADDETGALVENKESRKDFHQHIDEALKQYRLSIDESDPLVMVMVAAAQLGDFYTFKQAYLSLNIKNRNKVSPVTLETLAETVWLDVSSLLARLPHSVTEVSLPKRWTPDLPGYGNNLLASDSGTSTIVRLPGANSLRGSDLWATLNLGGVQVSSTSITFIGQGELLIEFPSGKSAGLCTTAAAGVTPPPTPCGPSTLRICRISQRWEDDSEAGTRFTQAENGSYCADTQATYRLTEKAAKEAEKPKAPSFSVAIGATVIVATGASGTLRLDVTKDKNAAPDDTFVMSVKGGDVVSVSTVDSSGRKVAIPAKEGGYETKESVTLLLELTNLDPSVKVRITAKGTGTTDPHVLDVLRLPKSPTRP